MINRTNMKAEISTRERVVLWLILLMVRILAPWEYEHQFEGVIGELTAILKERSEREASK